MRVLVSGISWTFGKNRNGPYQWIDLNCQLPCFKDRVSDNFSVRNKGYVFVPYRLADGLDCDSFFNDFRVGNYDMDTMSSTRWDKRSNSEVPINYVMSISPSSSSS